MEPRVIHYGIGFFAYCGIKERRGLLGTTNNPRRSTCKRCLRRLAARAAAEKER
jgi:hypothetical protein